jgi:hypothetical protein
MEAAMLGQDVIFQSNFERALTVGHRVEVRWTNSHYSYVVPATVVTINEASIVVTLDTAVERNGEVIYRAGRRIRVPRLSARHFSSARLWSTNNGVFRLRVNWARSRCGRSPAGRTTSTR